MYEGRKKEMEEIAPPPLTEKAIMWWGVAIIREDKPPKRYLLKSDGNYTNGIAGLDQDGDIVYIPLTIIEQGILYMRGFPEEDLAYTQYSAWAIQF
jgi:hypothetical protein